MAGYLNRFIDLEFPELGGTDDEGKAIVWVQIRNPRLMPADHLLSTSTSTKIKVGPDGKPVEVDTKIEDTYGWVAKIVVDGYVWDALSLDDEAPLIAMPPKVDDIRKFPIGILNRIGEEVSKANPR
jgi:hypothetical protein